MAAPRVLLLLIAASLALAAGVAADAGIGVEIPSASGDGSAVRAELEQVRSKISALESGSSDRARELKSKDEKIAQLEKDIQEKSAGIVLLQGEIELLQEKGSVDAEQVVGKAYARADQLEKQVKELANELQTLGGLRDALEVRASEAEKKLQELTLHVQNLEKTTSEEKRLIQKMERALQVAEEELMRSHLDATSKSKELSEIHGAWLPPWLAKFIYHCQDRAMTHWIEHGKPALDILVQKTSEKSDQVHQWAVPHLATVKTKLIPAAKEQWTVITTYAGPYVETVSTKSIETYHICKNTVVPHVVKAQQVADPYVQEAKKFVKPHIEQIATATKPHVEKARVTLKPYTNPVINAYGKFLISATLYHNQVQSAVEEKLKKHELTRTLATKELVWFLASALLALPIFFAYRIVSAMFSKKGRRPARISQENNTSRRPKRRHVDK